MENSQVLLFHSASPEELREEAKKQSKAVLKKQSNSDFFHFTPEGKSYLYSMDKIHHIISDVSLPPTECEKKVYLLEEIDRMLPAHANALLKTLEESPHYAVFLMTTPHLYLILPTITSRCQKVHVQGSQEEFQCSEEMQDKIGKAIEAAKNKAYHSLFSQTEAIDSAVNETPEQARKCFGALLKHVFQGVSKQCPEVKQELIFQQVAKMQEAYDRHTKVKVLLEASLMKLCPA